ncbi:MAG: hypothetical protein OXC54_09985 [Rhodospirillaceae bacterium]|nr:hypothetical protein [Rhodospirillaceae bacterium]
MSEYILSHHSKTRMNQRGRRSADLELIWRYGSQVGSDILYLSRRDVRRAIHPMNWEIQRLERLQRVSADATHQREIRRHKREIQALERLSGSKLVVAGGTVVTCYRSNRRDQKRTLRRDREFA